MFCHLPGHQFGSEAVSIRCAVSSPPGRPLTAAQRIFSGAEAALGLAMWNRWRSRRALRDFRVDRRAGDRVVFVVPGCLDFGISQKPRHRLCQQCSRSAANSSTACRRGLGRLTLPSSKYGKASSEALTAPRHRPHDSQGSSSEVKPSCTDLSRPAQPGGGEANLPPPPRPRQPHTDRSHHRLPRGF